MEIQKIMVMSTAHITERDNETLSIRSFPFEVEVLASECGYMIYVGSDPALLENHIVDFINADLSDSFIKLALFAQANLCAWLHLDRDGPVILGFQEFDW